MYYLKLEVRYTLLFLILSIFLLIKADEVKTYQNFDELPLVIRELLMEEVSKNVKIDSLNKQIIKETIFDSLDVIISQANIPKDSIVQFNTDISVKENYNDDYDITHPINIMIQIVYESSNEKKQEIKPFFKDDTKIELSTTNQILLKSFTLNIDNSLLTDKNEITEDNNINEVIANIDQPTNNKPSIFGIVENGVHIGFSYKDIKPKIFENKNLTNVSIPEGIQSIGIRAFAINKLSVLNIPNSVTHIEAGAFADNVLEIISIGENVNLGRNAIGKGFEMFYDNNDKKAGYYVYKNSKWAYEKRVSSERIARKKKKNQ
jgi:hypothetical protein